MINQHQGSAHSARAREGELRRRLTELRGGPDVPPRPLDARALAALAANPGCRRRALLDGAGVDKGGLAASLGAPAPFGQSQFAFVRGNAFEARVKADGGAELIGLLCARTGEVPPEPGEIAIPDLSAEGPAGRTARTRIALEETAPPGGRDTADSAASPGTSGTFEPVGTSGPSEAEAPPETEAPPGTPVPAGSWALLDHPMLALDVAGSTAYLEPDAIAVHPDGDWSVIEIKSFPVLDGSADPAKVGAAARQSAVYALALDALTAEGLSGTVRDEALLVCPKDFSNLPTAHGVDIRKQRAATRRQLARLTRVEEIAATLPDGTVFDPSRPADELAASVAAVPARYAPDCLAGCELAFHCRAQARAAGAVESLGRSVRGELGGLTTIPAVLAAAHGDAGPGDGDGSSSMSGSRSGTGGQERAEVPDPADAPAAEALRRAALLRAEALASAVPHAGQGAQGAQSEEGAQPC